jgi:hypothetical protein
MARIKKELVAQREKEVIEMFTAGATVKEANEALFVKYGKRMGLDRIYGLRAAVRAKLESAAGVPQPASTETTADPAAETPVA